MEIFNVVLNFLFISSLIYILYVLIVFSYKLFAFFRMNDETVRFEINNLQLIMLWIALTITIFNLVY